MTTTAIANPLDTLPLSPSDRRFLEKVLDMLSDESVNDYDFQEAISTPYGLNVYRHWEDARTTPVIRFADHRPALGLDSFGIFEPIPSRQDVEHALREAATAWEEVYG